MSEKETNKVKKRILDYLKQNFPEYNELNYLELTPNYSKLELTYGREGIMIIEIGISEGSQYKLLSTNFR